MNLLLSRRGDYVVRSAICLARAYDEGGEKDGWRKIREVVSEMGVPRSFASQVLSDLVHAGLVTSKAGKDGGYRLARSPESVRLIELVEAAEGELSGDRCALGEGPCGGESRCPLHDTWVAATAGWRDTLFRATLAEILERDRSLECGTYVVPTDSHRSGGAVTVEDSVQVEIPAPGLAARLADSETWLGKLAHEAHTEGEAARVRLGPAGASWLAKEVELRLGKPVVEGSSVRLPLSWQATGVSGLFPRLSGEMTVRSIDPERSELKIEGRYRPPLGRTGQRLDDALLGHLARATIRSFLRRVARAAEDLEPLGRSAGMPAVSTVGPAAPSTPMADREE